MTCYSHDDSKTERLFAQATELLANGDAAAAKPMLMHLLDHHTDSISKWNVSEFLGECLFDLEDFVGALQALTMALKGDDDSIPQGHNKLHILHYIALSNFRLERWNAAINSYVEAQPLLSLYENDEFIKEGFEFYIGKGRCYLHLDKDELALTEFKISETFLFRIPEVQKSPVYSSRLNFELGRTYLRLRRLDEAWQCLELIVPDHLKLPYSRWYAQARIDYSFYRMEYGSVIEEYQRDYKFETPENEKAELLYVVGVSYYHLGNHQEANRYILNALEAQPSPEWLRNNARQYLEWMDKQA